MKNLLIYIYMILMPLVNSAQGVDRPEPRPRNGAVVVKKKGKGKINRLLIGYDNQTNYQFLTIGTKPSTTLKAVERVIFEYDYNGLNIYAYVPKVNESLDETFLSGFQALLHATKQEKSGIQLFHFKYSPDATTIKESVDSEVSIDDFKRNKIGSWSEAFLNTELAKTVTYQDYWHNSRKVLRDKYRKYKHPKSYIEFGSIAGFSYRTIQVVNPLPDRTLYESRLREDKAQFSWSGSLRGGYNISKSHSVYAGLLYLHQQFSSSGKVDWNTGLIADVTTNQSQNRFDYWGTEIGYSYMYFAKKNEISVDIGLDLLRANNQNSIHKFTFGPNIAIGPKFRIGSGADLRVMPIFYYNIRGLEKHQSGASQQELASRMFTLGIKMGVRWN